MNKNQPNKYNEKNRYFADLAAAVLKDADNEIELLTEALIEAICFAEGVSREDAKNVYLYGYLKNAENALKGEQEEKE